MVDAPSVPYVIQRDISTSSVKDVITECCCKYHDRLLQHRVLLVKKIFKPTEEVKKPKKITPAELATILN